MDEIEKSVFLLRMFTRESDESMRDVINSLANTGMFSVKEGRRIRRELESDGYISDGELTLKGIAEAQKAQEEFRL